MKKIIVDADLICMDENGDQVHVRPTNHAEQVAGLEDFVDNKFASQISPVINQLRGEMEEIKTTNGEGLGDIQEKLKVLDTILLEVREIKATIGSLSGQLDTVIGEEV